MICIIKKSEESKGKTCSLLVPRAGTWQSQWAGGRREMLACRVASRTSCRVLRLWGPQAFPVCLWVFVDMCMCPRGSKPLCCSLCYRPRTHFTRRIVSWSSGEGLVRAACWQGVEGRALGSSSEAHPSSKHGFTCSPSWSSPCFPAEYPFLLPVLLPPSILVFPFYCGSPF